ncbi:hypothetical protein VST7929_02211 [Vibrio stylophorae]|uniref:Uncharacterized protein n=1 Tax=Vibrio stylophorae TaxID=659351 RepID=A0ABM8ZVD7_9VIBR|nr:hypothetical protein VST7929_02211 [Vibrio stylophorae]
MFAGVGSEILYRTLNSNWAWGLMSTMWAQRDPDNTFSVFTEEVQYDQSPTAIIAFKLAHSRVISRLIIVLSGLGLTICYSK